MEHTPEPDKPIGKSGPKLKKDKIYQTSDLVDMIVEWKSQGLPHYSIIRNIVALDYSTTYAYHLIHSAMPRVQEVLKHIAVNRLESVIAELERTKQDCLDEGDKATALQYTKEINKMLGLDATKLDITSGGDKITQISVIKLTEIKNKEHENENEN